MTTAVVPSAFTVQQPDDWYRLLEWLPADLAQTAFADEAFVRARGVPDAASLLRLAFAYACNLSLAHVAAWAAATAVADLSPTALRERLRRADVWLGHLLAQLLTPPGEASPRRAGFRIRLVDGTTMTHPGSATADWRLHLGLDLHTLRFDFLRLSRTDVGESFTQVPVCPGDVLVGDRAFGTRKGIAAITAAGGHVLVRLNWKNVPLQRADGTAFDLLGAMAALPPGAIQAYDVRTVPTRATPAVAGRVILRRLRPDEAARARQTLQRTRRYQGAASRDAMDARTWIAVDYMVLFTTVPSPELTAEDAVAAYRFRWQIELAIKRLKSLGALGQLPAKDPRLNRTVSLARLLLAVLADCVCRHAADAFSP
jgi:hypothetical protein